MDEDLNLDIYVGVEGSFKAVAALGEVEDALAGISARGPGTTAIMDSIARAAARMDGVLSKNAGGAESAARGLALLKGEASGLREAYAQIAAANLDSTPEQRLELFGPENVAAAKAAMAAIRVSIEGDLEAVEAKARSTGEAMEQALRGRSEGYAAVAAEQYENLLASMTPVEAAARRLSDAQSREAQARAAATSAGASYAAMSRGSSKGTIEAAEAATRHGQALRDLAEAMRQTRAAQSAYTRETEAAARATGQIGERAQQAEVRVQALQYALFYTSFTLTAMGAIGVKALKDIFGTTIELESQFAQVARTVEDYTDSTRIALQGIGTEIPASLESIAEIAALGGALNINASNIVAFTTTVSKLTATTNLTEQAAGTLIGRMDALLDLDPEGSDFEKIGAAVLSVGAQSAATESQVAAMAAQVAGLGKNVGLTAPQIIGWSGALASVGVSAELGRSSLQRIFNQLNTGVRMGGVRLATLARITGQTGEQFRRSLGEDASGALLSVVGGLRQMTDSGEDTVKVLSEIGIRNVRDVYALQQLAAAYDNTAASLDNATLAYENSAETMDRYYGPIAATTAARIQILETTWTRFIDAIGSSSTGPLNDIIAQLTEIIELAQEFVKNDPEGAARALSFVALATGVLLAAGAFAQLGSSAANILFVRSQLQLMNAATLPAFVRNMLLKIKVLDADTVAAQLNAAANTKAAAATTSLGAAALKTAGNIAKGLARFALWIALFGTLATVGNIVTNVLFKTDQSINDIFNSIGRGDSILAGMTEGLLNVSLALLSVSEGFYTARAWVDDMRGGDGQAINDADPFYQDLMNRRRVTEDALDGLKDGMSDVGGEAAEAAEEVETYGESLDDASRKALELSGQTDILAMSVDEVPESVKAATNAVVAFTESLAKSAEEYIKFQEIVNASVSKDEEGNAIGVGGVGESATTKALDEILAGYNSRNDGAQAFQKNLIEIGEMGGQALATVLAETGVENAAGIAEALVNSPEHQRQFQIQARIAGLLANKAFTLALGSGAGNSGISDVVATQMAELGADIDTIFGAIEASSYGVGSAQWKNFVEGWNAENSATPLTFDSFDFAPLETAVGDVAQMFYESVQDQFAQSIRGPQGPVRVDVPIDPNFLFDAQGNDTRYANLMAPVVAGLQSQLDASVITPPMVFDTIAVVNGYESWKAYVAARPTLAQIDTTVGWDSVSAMIEAIRAALRRQMFSVNVEGRVRIPGALSQGTVGQYAVAKGGYIDGGGVGHFARGGGWGLIRGRGTGTSDSVPSWLSKGEYVQTASAVSHYGVPMMDAIRSKSFPTTEDFASLIQKAMSVSGNQASGPQSVTNVAVTQMYPQTVDPLKKLREDSENVVAGLFG